MWTRNYIIINGKQWFLVSFFTLLIPWCVIQNYKLQKLWYMPIDNYDDGLFWFQLWENQKLHEQFFVKYFKFCKHIFDYGWFYDSDHLDWVMCYSFEWMFENNVLKTNYMIVTMTCTMSSVCHNLMFLIVFSKDIMFKNRCDVRHMLCDNFFFWTVIFSNI